MAGSLAYFLLRGVLGLSAKESLLIVAPFTMSMTLSYVSILLICVSFAD